MIHPALIVLLKLRWRGWVRRVFRSFRSVKHALLYSAGLCLFLASVLIPVLIMVATRHAPLMYNPETVAGTFSTILLVLCLGQLMVKDTDRAIVFSPPEIDFLFPGPFTRRQLLTYKIVLALGTILATSVIYSGWFCIYTGNWLPTLIGTSQALIFAYLAQTTLTLLQESVAERLYTRMRKLVLLAGLTLLAIGAWHALNAQTALSFSERLRAFRESIWGQVALTPFMSFGRAATAKSWFPDLALWGGLAVLTNAALVALVFRLDADYLEASLARSQKLYDKVRKIQTTGSAMAGRSVQRQGWRLPMLPHWAGAGVIAWRQSVAWLRKSSPVLLVLFLAVPFVPALAARASASPVSVWVPLGLLIYLSVFFFPVLFAFDFRSEVEHMDSLKMLPFRSIWIVVGEILTPTIVSTFLHLLVMGGLVAFLFGPRIELLVAALFALPFNLTFFGIENALFLLFPVNPTSSTTPGMQNMVRQMLFAFAKMGALVLLAAVAGGLGAAAYFVSGQLWWAFLAVAWLSTVGFALGLLPMLAWAFRRYDPSREVVG